MSKEDIAYGRCILKVVQFQLSDGLIREDRYMDTGHLDDYYVIFSCRDRASARRGRCFNYFVSLLVRDDPPANFPWDKALREFKKFGIAARDIILFYVDEGKQPERD